MRTDSATVASVWSRNTTTETSDSAAAGGSTQAHSPSTARRRLTTWVTARAPTSSGAIATRPCGARVTESIAMTTATAVGHSARVPTVRSTSIQTATTAKAISGSGRSPLLKGSQAARNTVPAVHTATRLTATRLPSRGSTHRDRISHVAIPAAVAGRRIQTPAVLIEARCASTLWYQSNGASDAPKYRK